MVICATTPNHDRDALTALEHGIPVLIEKSLALALPAAQNLVSVAERQGLMLCVCLPLLETSYIQGFYIQGFKAACTGRVITSLQFRWFDPASETRYGDIKRVDLSTRQVDEIVPRIWSLIDVLIDSQEPEVVTAMVGNSDETSLHLSCDAVDVIASFGRRTARRERRLDVSFADAATA